MRLRRLVYVNQTTLRQKEDNSKAITNFLCCYQFADKNERFPPSHSRLLCLLLTNLRRASSITFELRL